eukprot:PhM_4_TR15649/c0_g1_i2/m.6747
MGCATSSSITSNVSSSSARRPTPVPFPVNDAELHTIAAAAVASSTNAAAGVDDLSSLSSLAPKSPATSTPTTASPTTMSPRSVLPTAQNQSQQSTSVSHGVVPSFEAATAADEHEELSVNTVYSLHQSLSLDNADGSFHSSTLTHWVEHRCMWTSTTLHIPPTWTHERIVYLNGQRVVTVFRDPATPEISMHVLSTKVEQSDRRDGRRLFQRTVDVGARGRSCV